MTIAKQGSPRAAKRKKTPTYHYDWGLLTIVMSLLAIGLVMVFSASYAQSLNGFATPYRFIIRQSMWAGLAVCGLFVMARIDYSKWEQFSIPLMGLALLTLLAVITIGSETYGSKRTFFGGSVQPSEPAKVAIIMYVSAWLASKGRKIRDVRVGLLPFSVLMGIVTVLIVIQPDISTALIIVTTASIMLFISGAKLNQLLVVAVGGAGTFALVIRYSTYAGGRVERFINAFQNPLQSEEWQTVQSIQAMINGQIFGVGVGNSTAKLPGYLPVSWSDNIFAIIGEELGLLGALLVIFLFALFAYRGLRIALNAPDNFGMLLATGITSMLVLQAILNIAVVVAVAPATGVTLPFISYGGSSLVTALGAVGILLSISRYSEQLAGSRNAPRNIAYARFNFGWRDRGTRLSGTGRRRTTSTRRKSTRRGQTKSRSSGPTGTSRTAARRTSASRTTTQRRGGVKSSTQRSSRV